MANRYNWQDVRDDNSRNLSAQHQKLYELLLSYVKPHPPALAVAPAVPQHHLQWA
jgi:hypothetical protein